MNRKSFVCAGALLLLAAGIVYAAGNDAFLGTWKLNEAKSKIAPGLPKNSTVVNTADGDNMKVAIDGTDAKGQPYHSEWTGKFDGKDYAVTGDSASDMRSYKRVNAHTMTFTVKKGDKVTMTGRIAVAADGKSRTVTASGMDSMGMKISNTSVYDKQ